MLTLNDAITIDYASTPHLDFDIVLPPGYVDSSVNTPIIVVSIDGLEDHLIQDGKLTTTTPTVTAHVTFDQNSKLEKLYQDTVFLKYINQVGHEIRLVQRTLQGDADFLSSRKYYLSNYKGINEYKSNNAELYVVTLTLREI